MCKRRAVLIIVRFPIFFCSPLKGLTHVVTVNVLKARKFAHTDRLSFIYISTEHIQPLVRYLSLGKVDSASLPDATVHCLYEYMM